MFDKIGDFTLGTVQLGLNYGISNETGKPNESNAFKILDLAADSGINCLDTAAAYGESESVIGRYLQKRGQRKFRIITKIPRLPENCSGVDVYNFLEESLMTSLKNLRLENVWGLLVHNASDYFDYQSIFDKFINYQKTSNRIEKFGLSVYDYKEIERSFKNCDIFQAPLNVFDNDLIRKNIIKMAFDSGKFLFLRSIFLQGLFFLDLNILEQKLPEAKKYILELRKLSEKYSLSIQELCAGFAYHHTRSIGSLVTGVDTCKQLEANLSISEFYKKNRDTIERVSIEILSKFENMPEKIIRPYLW